MLQVYRTGYIITVFNMKYIITSKPDVMLENSIPRSWKGNIRILSDKDWPALIESIDRSVDEVYAVGDADYAAVAKSSLGFPNISKKLSDITVDKYEGRMALSCMKDIPFTICDDNIVAWPYHVDDVLFAKPVGGYASINTISHVRHGDILPDIQEAYIIEKYIEQKHLRITAEGFVCGDDIGILFTYDNIEYLDQSNSTEGRHQPGPRLRYLGHPSRYHSDPKMTKRFLEVVSELRQVTGCDRQMLNIEFFVIDGEFVVMEINPRISGNALPFYEKVSGVNPWLFMEHLLRGVVLPFPAEPPCTGVCRYTYGFNGMPVFTKHDEDTFSISLGSNDPFYRLFTYSTCDLSRRHYWQLIKDIDQLYPLQDKDIPQYSPDPTKRTFNRI